MLLLVESFRQAVSCAALVEDGIRIKGDEAQSCYVAAGLVNLEAQVGHLLFQGQEVVDVPRVILVIQRNNGKESSPAGRKAGIPDVWKGANLLLSRLNILHIIEIQGYQAVIVFDFVRQRHSHIARVEGGRYGPGREEATFQIAPGLLILGAPDFLQLLQAPLSQFQEVPDLDFFRSRNRRVVLRKFCLFRHTRAAAGEDTVVHVHIDRIAVKAPQ